ncbi:MAG: two-component system LytT family response regulator [Psychromonas sp.]|jgi:two-component system LytT family response regulator
MIAPKIHNRISRESEILFVTADQNYSIFHLQNGRKFTSGYTLKFHLKYLDEDKFLRINRSQLINKSFIRKVAITENKGFITLRNGKDIPIPRRRIKEIKLEYKIA